MKHCPACNFSFPDFHKVCDFDGTELVLDPERLALVKAPRLRTGIQRTLKSPVVWAAGLLMFVLSSAFLVAYLEATVESPGSTTVAPPPASPVDGRSAEVFSPHGKTNASNRPLASVNSPKSTALKPRRQTIASRSVPRRAQRTLSARSSKTETAGVSGQTEVKSSRQASAEKEPKLTAALKTTWRFLKKPFKF